MRYLYNKKKGFRGADGERSQFAFFVVGAVVLLAVAFVLGLQVGRIIEKSAEKRKSEADKVVGPIEIRKDTESEIQKDLKVFSQEPGKVPPVIPPSADARLNETEKSMTFRETLAKKEPEPILLVTPAPGTKTAEPPKTERNATSAKWMVQASAFRDKKRAMEFRNRLEKDGFPAALEEGKPGGLHKVLVGPYADKEAAGRAVRELKSAWKVNAFLLRR